MFFFREFDDYFTIIVNAEVEDILKVTGCKKPCFYQKYTFIGERHTTDFVHEYLVFSLWSVSNSTTVETELFVYSWTSLVAEFGGR